MKSGPVRRTLAGCTLLAIGFVLVVAGPVAADCDLQPRAPRTLEEATGQAFIGEFLGDGRGDFPREHRWRVEKEVRGVIDGDRVAYPVIGCHGVVGFVEGRRYLVSTSDLVEPNTGTRVAWAIAGDEVRLVAVERPRDEYPAVWQVDDLAEAIALVGRGDLPPTDQPESDGRLPLAEMLLLAVAVGSGAFVLREARLTA